MPVLVTFMRPDGIGSRVLMNVGVARLTETLTLSTGVTTANVALDGEIALICSTETATILGARGTTPNAAATASTPVTDAGFPIPPGILIPVQLRVGDKLNFKPIA